LQTVNRRYDFHGGMAGPTKTQDSQISDAPGEFPRINDQRTGLSHQYGYYSTTRGAGDWFTDGLAQHNYVTGETSIQTLDGVLTSRRTRVRTPPRHSGGGRRLAAADLVRPDHRPQRGHRPRSPGLHRHAPRPSAATELHAAVRGT
jgi:hypothetical protein